MDHEIDTIKSIDYRGPHKPMGIRDDPDDMAIGAFQCFWHDDPLDDAF